MRASRQGDRIAFLLIALVVAGLGVSACAASTAATPEAPTSLAITAPADAMPLIQEMADTLAHSRPGLQIRLTEAVGSADVSAVRSGAISMTVVMKPISDTKGLLQTEIARQPIAIIVQTDNQTKNLTLDDLSNIYTGRVSEWSQVSSQSMPIMVLSRDTSASTRERLDYSLIGPDSKLTPHALLLPSDEAMGLTVARRLEAIGYIAGTNSPSGTKFVSVGGESPSALSRGRYYPLWQPIILITAAQPPPEVDGFLTYVKSKQGKRLVTLWGYGQGADVP